MVNPYLNYYKNQIGSGIPGYRGMRRQKGYGMFSSLFSNTIMPLFKKLATSDAAKSALQAAKAPIAAGAAQLGKSVLDSTFQNMTGSGRRYKTSCKGKRRSVLKKSRKKKGRRKIQKRKSKRVITETFSKAFAATKPRKKYKRNLQETFSKAFSAVSKKRKIKNPKRTKVRKHKKRKSVRAKYSDIFNALKK